MVKLLQRQKRVTHHSATNSADQRKTRGRLFTGGLYAALALILLGWHVLLYQTSTSSGSSASRSVITFETSQRARRRPPPPAPGQRRRPARRLPRPPPPPKPPAHLPRVRSTGDFLRLDNNTYLTERPEQPIVVAYAISLIKVSVLPVECCLSTG